MGLWLRWHIIYFSNNKVQDSYFYIFLNVSPPRQTFSDVIPLSRGKAPSGSRWRKSPDHQAEYPWGWGTRPRIPPASLQLDGGCGLFFEVYFPSGHFKRAISLGVFPSTPLPVSGLRILLLWYNWAVNAIIKETISNHFAVHIQKVCQRMAANFPKKISATIPELFKNFIFPYFCYFVCLVFFCPDAGQVAGAI